MPAKYHPVNIKDPTSPFHLVRLRPYQDLKVCLKSSAGTDVLAMSEYFYQSSDCRNIKGTGSRELVFTQKRDVAIDEWARLTPFYLGEVIVDNGSSYSSLHVITEDPNTHKNDIVAVVNPKGNGLKVEPHQIIEVILYRIRDNYNENEWEYQFEPAKDGIGLNYECIRDDVLYPSVNYNTSAELDESVCVVYPRAPNTVHNEFHFWFRLDYESLASIKDIAGGTYSVGTLKFQQKLKSQVLHLNLYVHIREKMRALALKSLFSVSKYVVVSSFRNILGIPELKKDKPKEDFKTKIQDHNYDCGFKHHNWQHREKYLSVQPVSLKSKNTKEIDEGCRVIYCIGRDDEVDKMAVSGDVD